MSFVNINESKINFFIVFQTKYLIYYLPVKMKEITSVPVAVSSTLNYCLTYIRKIDKI